MSAAASPWKAVDESASAWKPVAEQPSAAPKALGDQPATPMGVARTFVNQGIEGAKGVAKGIGRSIADTGTAVFNPLGANPIANAIESRTHLGQKIHDITEPSNTAQTVGSYLPDAAMLLMPGGVAEQGAKLLPNAERAGKVLERVRGVAKDVPVDLTHAMTPALRAQELARAGSTPPKVMSDFLQRIPVHTSEPMMFPEARDFAANAGRLSTSERLATNPPMGAQVKQLARALSEANQSVAEQVGLGKEYAGAIKEYRRAKQLGEAKDAAIEIAKKWAPRAAIGGAAGAAGYKVAKSLGE